MPNKAWLKQHYAHLPKRVQRVLINKSLRRSVRELSKLLVVFPKIYAIHSRLENRYIDLGSNGLALRNWNRTRKIFPRIPNLYFERARWALERSKFIEAALQLRLCLKLDKGYFKDTAHFWRAVALYHSGSYELVRHELENVPDDYEELCFIGFEFLSKSELSAVISAKESQA